MTIKEYAALEKIATIAAREFIRLGVPRERAIALGTEMAMKAAKIREETGQYLLPPDGMGAVPVTPQPFDVLAESKAAADIAPIKAVREAISPWLWVTSLIGFGMGLLNSRRIARMYGDWRKKKGGRT